VSIRVMNMVFERYPVGGNEGMLALALADHAHDDGTHIWPSLESLARKTKQSRSSVRRHIQGMVAGGWLLLIKQSDGRAGGTNEYRINPAWIAGQLEYREGVNLNPSPVDSSVDKPGDNATGEGVNLEGEGVIAVVGEGVIAVVPESSGTVREPSIPPLPPVDTGGIDPKAEDRKPAGPKDRLRWRWADNRGGIEGRGEQLGLGRWDESAFHVGRGEHFAAYKAKVFAAHLGSLGVPTTPGVAARAIAEHADLTHSAVLRMLAGHVD
jgi:biotin operon repressor